MGNYKKILFLLFLCMIMVPLNVHAANNDKFSSQDGYICLNYGWSGSQSYLITYDEGKGAKVKGHEYQLTTTDVEGVFGELFAGCFCSHGNENLCTSKDKHGKWHCNADYEFKSQNLGTSCVRQETDDGYYFFSCPGDDTYNIVSDMTDNKNLTRTFDPGTKKYYVKFNVPDKFKGKVSGKLVGQVPSEDDGKPRFDIDSLTGLPNTIIRDVSAYEIENGIAFDPGSDYYIVFYLNDPTNICSGERLGYFQSVVPSTIPNTMYNDPLCTSLRNKNDAMAENMVPECFDEDIYFENTVNLYSRVSEAIAAYNSYNETIQPTTESSSTYVCQFENNDININKQGSIDNVILKDENGNEIVNWGAGPSASKLSETKKWLIDVEKGATQYWNALCTEKIYLEYDDPKAVKAGLGFNYNVRLVISRHCEPKRTAQPVFYPACSYGITCWGGPAKHHGEAGAGPDENFDTCINTCDGGKYTQSCINQCYDEVYGNKNNNLISFNDFKNISGNYGIVNVALIEKAKKGAKVGTDPAGNIVSSSCVTTSNNSSQCNGLVKCYNNQYCISEHGVKFTYLNGCNANGEIEGTKCYEVYKGYPCVIVPDGSGLTKEEEAIRLYEEKIEESERQYNEVMEKIKTYEHGKDETYKFTITEEYSKNVQKNYEKKSTIFSNDGSGVGRLSQTEKVVVTKSGTESYVNIADYSNGKVSSGFAEKHPISKTLQSYDIARELVLEMPLAYINRFDGNDVVYNKDLIPTIPNSDKDSKYFNGVNKYFTRLDTKPDVNNYWDWPYYNKNVTSDSTSNYTKNITVSLKNVGTWGQWGNKKDDNGIAIKCLYGTDEGLTSNKTGELRFIFRPIELTDVFPNGRDPRFNWTGTILTDNLNRQTKSGAAQLGDKSLYGYNVDPTAVKNNIESKGKVIYDDPEEIDYEFIITKEQIRNIRKYNKEVYDYNNDGQNNYLDYNMSCFVNTSGREICTSNFLDNINGNSGSDLSSGNSFVTYGNGYSIEKRHTIAECNNAEKKGSQCVIISN